MKKQKGKRLKWIIIAVAVLSFIGAVSGKGGKETNDLAIKNTEQEEHGITGIEVQKSEEELCGSIEDFSYELSGDTIILDEYNGKSEILEVKSSYIIDDSEYKTDLSSFMIGLGNQTVKTLIICEGITEVQDSVFNSSGVQNVFFPKSMTSVYDNTLSYLHPDEGDKIKVYYAGTQEEWEKIFTEYNRQTMKEAWESSEDWEEKGAATGKSLADKLNEMVDGGYDSSQFEYFFSANPDDLKK